jgi:hypothetical protein
MMDRRALLFTALVTGLGLQSGANAALVTFSDQTTFLTATGATSATGALPNLGAIPPASGTVGSVTFSSVAPSGTLFIGPAGLVPGDDWYGPLPGNDIAISGSENLDAVFAGPVYSFGFVFAEPSSSTMPPWGGSAVDSTFTVTLRIGATFVDSFTFNAPDDFIPPSFVGAWSDTAFDRVEIRETTGGIDDEYFGEFFTGTTPVPVPAAVWLLGSALVGLIGISRRRNA